MPDLTSHTQKANPFRVRSYHDAASTIRGLDRDVNELLHEQGIEGLDRIPHIGPVLARIIKQLVVTGSHPVIDRLRGEHDLVLLLATVPGIGRTLAERLHEVANVEALEQLEEATESGSTPSSQRRADRCEGSVSFAGANASAKR